MNEKPVLRSDRSVRASYLKTSPNAGAQQEAHYDRVLSFAVCFQISIVGIKNSLVQGIPELYNVNSTLNNVLLAIIALVYIWAFLESWNRIGQINISVVLFSLFLLLSYFATRILFPENIHVVHEWLPRMVPFYFVTAYMITNLSSTKWIAYYMKRFSLVILFFSVISSVYIYYYGHVTTSTWLAYSMPLSYVTMLAVMWVLYYYFENHKFYMLAVAVIGIVIIVLYGSRNPLIAIISYVIVKYTRNVFSPESGILKKTLFFFSLILLVLGLAFYKNILFSLDDFLKSYNINSRTLRLMARTEMDLTGRSDIHNEIFALMAKQPLLGLGLGGDVQQTGFSSHSLYLSILSAYGFLFGSALIIAMLICCLKAYLKAERLDREVLLIYLCLTLPRGFFGGDFSSSDVLWWMLGICVVIFNQPSRLNPVKELSVR